LLVAEHVVLLRPEARHLDHLVLVGDDEEEDEEEHERAGDAALRLLELPLELELLLAEVEAARVVAEPLEREPERHAAVEVERIRRVARELRADRALEREPLAGGAEV